MQIGVTPRSSSTVGVTTDGSGSPGRGIDTDDRSTTSSSRLRSTSGLDTVKVPGADGVNVSG